MSLIRNFDEQRGVGEVVYPWRRPFHIGGCVFLGVWIVLSGTIFCEEILQLLNGELAYPQNLFAGASYGLMLVVPFYWMLIILLNRTVIRLTRSEIEICHGPVPWLYADARYGRNDFLYVFVEDYLDGDGDVQKLEVMGLMRDGSSRRLVPNVHDEEDAEKVRRKLNEWLRQKNPSSWDGYRGLSASDDHSDRMAA